MDLEACYQLIYESKPELKFCERYNDSDDKWNFSVHSHPCMELLYTVGGKGETRTCGRTLTLSLYDLILYPAHSKHQSIQIPEIQQEIYCLWIELPGLKLEDAVYLHDRENVLGSVIVRLYHETKRESPNAHLLEYELKALLTLIFREQSEASPDAPLLSCVLRHIDEHLAEKLTLDELAQMCHISKSYLSRKFKERTGETVISYINHKRIDAASQMLIFTNTDIDEISFRLGFESPKYFYRVFKKLTGESPTGFRHKYKITK